jgi:predicted metal-dependent phosphoesterase TrpH
MTPHHQKIQFTYPLIDEIREKGYLPVDMHVHTHHSDAAIRIPSLVNRAQALGIGVAVTDHNEIGGALEAATHSPDLPMIPGIELNSLEGPHILLYFYTMADLSEFFSTHVRGDLKKSQYMALQLPVAEILEAAEGYRCVKVAAHPFGYFGIDRGVLKCIEKETLPPGTMNHIDGIEVICGAMSRDINEKAAGYAGEHDLPVTGGSDAHVLPAVGGVVTCVKADTVEGFLDGILSRESIVIGSTAHPLHKGMAAGVIAWNFIPSAVSSLQVHYEENIPRMKQYLRNLVK